MTPKIFMRLSCTDRKQTIAISYCIAFTHQGWPKDEVSLGPLALNEEARFTLAAPELPESRVRIERRAAKEEWTLTRLLPSRRSPGIAPQPGHGCRTGRTRLQSGRPGAFPRPKRHYGQNFEG